MLQIANQTLKLHTMKELKIKYEALKSLAKEMMKTGNVSEYFRLISEISKLETSPVLVKNS